MEYPLISVVTCTYKRFDTIYRTIDSLLEQDYPSIEYIISDDGSDGFPYEEICDYIEKNKKDNLIAYRIIQNTINLGTVRNINGAFMSARGKYVMGLAGDDIYCSNNVISTVVERMEKHNSNVVIASRIACDSDFVPQYILPHYWFRRKLLAKDTPQKQHELFISGQHFAMASGSAMFFRKSFLDKEGYFDERYVLWEDGPYLEKYFRKYKIDMAYDIMSIKYQLGGISTGTTVSEKLLRDVELYDTTDRIEQINKSSKFYRKLTLINVRLASKKTSKIDKLKMIVVHPSVIIYKLYYKLIYCLAEIYDKKIVMSKLINKKEDN